MPGKRVGKKRLSKSTTSHGIKGNAHDEVDVGRSLWGWSQTTFGGNRENHPTTKVVEKTG